MYVGIIYDRRYLLHKTPNLHPEKPERLTSIVSNLKNSPLKNNVRFIRPRKATEEEITMVHDLDYLNLVKEVCERGGDWLDLDTYASPKTYEVARLAVGGLLKGIEALMKSEIRYIFALVRPPGHHATKTYAGGFCIFNNIAVATAYTFKKYPIKRIAILDWDVHHGNGTQDIFYRDPLVLYVSLHEWGIYPGTGWYTEIGLDKGEGYNVNLPLLPGIADDVYFKAFDIAISIIKEFKPELILISSGFDAHFRDPLAHLNLSSLAYWKMIKKVVEEIKPKLGILLTLEGGYDLKALTESTLNVIRALLNLEPKGEYLKSTKTKESVKSSSYRLLKEEISFLRRYWSI
ncbi:MAG: histone deacetylase [Thermoprotei archaeon]|nr:MAG: histone deacetylase [Thermoprotei archaeon]